MSVLLLTVMSCTEPVDWSGGGQVAEDAAGIGGILAGQTLTDDEWRAVIAAAEASTFEVHNEGCEFRATGSAVVVGPLQLVTNRHVVDGARTLSVEGPGTSRIPVIDWRVSTVDDLALLTVAKPVSAPPLEVTSTVAQGGDLVAALGYPMGGPLTTGRGRIVSVNSEDDSTDLRASMDVLPGNSGGPMIDTTGRLVGVVRALDLVEGWAVAIGSDRVALLLDRESTRAATACAD